MTQEYITINGVSLSTEGIKELRGLQEERNVGIDAHIEGLQEVTSFLLGIADELSSSHEHELLNACKSLNYVRCSLVTLRSPIEKEVRHG
jgi:hypothetical protein